MTDDCTVLLNNLDKLHTTSMGIERIKRNLCPDTTDVVRWCYDKIKALHAQIKRKGKTGNTNIDNCHITVNAQITSEFILGEVKG